MNIIKIPKKKKGEFRTICAPSIEEKINIQKFLPVLNKKAENSCDKNIVHGFMIGKSPATNAMAHRGFRFSLCFDLSNFFDSVSEKHLTGKLTKEESANCLYQGVPMQGLPTSPVIANLAAIPMDKAIKKYLGKLEQEVSYTRYADDLTFSFNFYWTYEKLIKEIPSIVARCGFKINEGKTRLQDSLYGRRVITGVSVGYFNIAAPRSIRRRMRAAKHQKNFSSLKGLGEWNKMKLPRKDEAKEEVVVTQYNQNEISALSSAWGLGKIDANKIPIKKEDRLTENIIITGDPAYILGMSTITNGWKSCMAYGGSYFFGVKFWLYLRGARVAVMQSDKEVTIAGVKRKCMKARALIFNFRNGAICHGRIYGDSPETIKEFGEKLRANGIPEAKNGIGKVEGHVPKSLFSKRPYYDTGSSSTGKAKGGAYSGKDVVTYSI